MDIYTLFGKRHLECSIICLNSFQRHYLTPHNLIPISDGSLSKNEIAATEKRLHLPVFDSRDFEEPEEYLKKYPNLYREYHRWPYYKKVIDIPKMAKGYYRFIDSDIFFFRDFEGLFSNDETTHILAEDVAVNPGIRDILKWRGKCCGKANSGIIQGPQLAFEECDKLLAFFSDSNPQYREQLLFGFAWSAKNLELVSRESVYIASRWEAFVQSLDRLHQSNAAGFHLTGPRKERIGEAQKFFRNKRLDSVTIAKVKNPTKSKIATIASKCVLRLLRKT